MAQNVTIAGASYPDVPSIVVPKTGGGSAAFLDTSDADATAADVRSGKKFYGSSGSDTGSMPDGSAATPATTITANPTITVSSSGLITASVSKSQNVTPTVSPGYVANGTAGTIAVSGSNTNQLATQAGQTITPGTSDIVIPAQKFLTGAQTIKGDANLVAANIAKDVTIFGVTGTLSGGFSNSDALIHVNAPYGSTVTFAKGGVTVKVLSPSDAFNSVDGETADYYYSVTSTNFGSWTVTATLSGKTVSKTVSVSAAKQYDAKLAFHVPVEYQEIEFIGTTGTQYIDSGITLNGTQVFEISADIMLKATVGNEQPLFSIWTSSYGYWNLFVVNDGRQLDCYVNEHRYFQTLTLNTKYSYSFMRSGSTWTSSVDGTPQSFSKSVADANPTTLKFMARGDRQTGSWFNLYRTTVTKDNILAGDFYPCYRMSDNVGGMWDNVSGTFKTNAGSGSFILGSPV